MSHWGAFHNGPPAAARTAGRIFVGTCGYAYPDWRESGFYPPDIRAGAMLSFYARTFPITELNTTWYQMPREEGMERLLAQAPAGFLFTVKLHRSLSHEAEPSRTSSQTAAFRRGLTPLLQSRRLAAVLLQFPECFDRSPAHRRRLTSLLELLSGLPLAVEFRHDSWAADKVFAEMEKRQVALVLPDAPGLSGLFPPLRVATHRKFLYVRFHGRNREQWNRGGFQRLDYDYTEAELQEWIERQLVPMADGTRQAFLFFNNHVRGQAARNAATLARLIGDYGLELGKLA